MGTQSSAGYCPERDGPAQPCYCGKENCIESFISGTGFARRYGEQAPAEAITPPRKTANRRRWPTGGILLTLSAVAWRR